MVLYRIVAPHFVAGLTLEQVQEGTLLVTRVTETAPILKYMKGWPHSQVITYCGKKGWTIDTIEC